MTAARTDVIGSQISCCDSEQVLAIVERQLGQGAGGYVCFANVHSTVTGRRDERFRRVINESLLSVADGKPVFWAGRARGASGLGHVPGPDFMLLAMTRFPERRHYLYGSTPVVVAALIERLRQLIPGINICGSHSPPFRASSQAEQLEDYERMRTAGAEFVWVGLGAPKQEFWMAEAAAHVAPAILFGVGAAFDFHAGTLRRAPPWLRHLGLEWLFRLAREPRRLWRRYLVTNTLFVWYLLRDPLRPSSWRKGND